MSIEVNCLNLENNPQCAHGPTLKFTRFVKGKPKSYFACAFARDRKGCPFYLDENDSLTKSKLLSLEDWSVKNFPKIDVKYYEAQRHEIMQLESKKRQFCKSCFEFVLPKAPKKHLGHEIITNITDKMLCKPSKLLYPIDNDKKEAQYWFNQSTKKFLINSIKRFKFESVICIGTPTLHELLDNSLLLDMDYRYYLFYGSDKFCRFNMFNFHFFEKSDLETLNKMPKKSLVVIDPPFGARLEPLHATIDKLKQISSDLKFMLVLPYFMEQHVSKFGFEMMDYVVRYDNHKKFKTNSPVRIFTDLDCSLMDPGEDGYYFCKLCLRWRCQENKHCQKCGTCTSKNGNIYKHCEQCKICVKATWTHCSKCLICKLPDHVCNSNNIKQSYKNSCKKRRT